MWLKPKAPLFSTKLIKCLCNRSIDQVSGVMAIMHTALKTVISSATNIIYKTMYILPPEIWLI